MAAEVLFQFLVWNIIPWCKAAITELLDHHHCFVAQYESTSPFSVVSDGVGEMELSKQCLMYQRIRGLQKSLEEIPRGFPLQPLLRCLCYCSVNAYWRAGGCTCAWMQSSKVIVLLFSTNSRKCSNSSQQVPGNNLCEVWRYLGLFGPIFVF